MKPDAAFGGALKQEWWDWGGFGPCVILGDIPGINEATIAQIVVAHIATRRDSLGACHKSAVIGQLTFRFKLTTRMNSRKFCPVVPDSRNLIC